MTVKLITDDMQEAFDIVARHLHGMTERSGGDDEFGTFRCRYRGEGDAMCAVGRLIEPETYTPDIEGFSVWMLIAKRKGLAIPEPVATWRRFLIELQDAHDRPELWDKNGYVGHHVLRRIARKHGLSEAVIDELTGGPLRGPQPPDPRVEELF